MVLGHDPLALGRVVVAHLEVLERRRTRATFTLSIARRRRRVLDHVQRVAAQARVVAQRERRVALEQVLARTARARVPARRVHRNESFTTARWYTRAMAIVTPIDVPAGARRRLQISSPVTRERDRRDRSADRRRRARRARARAQGAAGLGRARRSRSACAWCSARSAVLVETQDRIVEIVVRESGKPATEALHDGSVRGLRRDDLLDASTRRACLRTERVPLHGLLRFTKKLEIVYRPLGVVGVISPWNGPVILSLNPTVQALLAGNAVLLKPSEVTPFSGQIVGRPLPRGGASRGRARAADRRRRDRRGARARPASTRSRSRAASRRAGGWRWRARSG